MNSDSPVMKRSRDRPFYQPPENVATSSKIINEARTSLKTVETKRPFTPREARTLFGPSSNRTADTRPPSTFSLESHHFDGTDSRPPSGTRLSPLDHSATHPQSELESRIMYPKPPTDPNRSFTRKMSGHKQSYQTTGAAMTLVDHVPLDNEERGEEDVKEMPVRNPSALPAPRDMKHARVNNCGARKPSNGESSEDDSVYQQYILPILNDLSQPTAKSDAESLVGIIDHLHTTLDHHTLLGKACRRRSSILKALFKLLDVDNAKLLLKLARLILSLNVSGNNLTNVCKLIYKVSRDESNDKEFLLDNLLEILVVTVSMTDQDISWEALVYCVGAFKFLTANSAISKVLVKKDTIEALTLLLQRAITVNKNSGKKVEEIGNILIQLTASLRNLADVPHSRERFITMATMRHLCDMMTLYHEDTDLMLNISRLFSKLTLHTDCCHVLAELRCYKWFIHILRHQPSKENLVVRVSFILGNLTARNDHSRENVYNESGCLETLLHIIQLYMNKSIQFNSDKTGISTKEDVLVKVVRVIANLSINERIGRDLVLSEPCLQQLIAILECRHVKEDGELVLNTIATINNLTYYLSEATLCSVHISHIADCLLKLLSAKHTETLLECTRVFANLTQHQPLRDYLFLKKLGEVMVALLDSDNRELVYTSCGVLVNFMVDDDKRCILKQEAGLSKLVDVLSELGQVDWSLASVVCQVLWNYSDNLRSSTDCFGEEIQRLTDILFELTDKETALTSAVIDLDEGERSFIHQVWSSEFYPVASELLHRIDTHNSQFVALE